MKKVLTILVISTIAITSFSCKKVEGPAGPTGPQGPQGAAGNANVLSTVYNVSSANWGWDATYALWYADLIAPDVTNAVMSNGAVMCYMVYSSGANQALPFSYHDFEWAYFFNVGLVEVQLQAADGSTLSNPGATTFRIVVIPPAARMAHPHLNLKDYSQVKAAYNLKD